MNCFVKAASPSTVSFQLTGAMGAATGYGLMDRGGEGEEWFTFAFFRGERRRGVTWWSRGAVDEEG